MAQPSQVYPPWLTPVPSVVTDAAGSPVATVVGVSYIAPTYYGPSVSAYDGDVLSCANSVDRFRWDHSTVMEDTHFLQRSCGLVLQPLLQEYQPQWSLREFRARPPCRPSLRLLQNFPLQLRYRHQPSHL